MSGLLQETYPFGSSGNLVAMAICFGPGYYVLVLSETVLVLERSLVDAFMRVLRNFNSIPQSNSHHPSTSTSTSTSSYSHGNS
jgi:hypothetical protein